MTLWTFSDGVFSNVATVITLTIRNIKCEVIGSINYGKVYQFEILFLAKMVFKINVSCTASISVLVSLSSMKYELIKY